MSNEYIPGTIPETTELTAADQLELEEFKKREWAIADAEHYGDDLPNFEKTSFTLLSNLNGMLIGYIRVDINQGIATIESLIVSHEHHGTGTGKKLIQDAEAKAISLGAHKITLETGANWREKGFYEHLGYQLRTVLPDHVAGQDFVLMDKML